jgi:hypothetical protein
MDCDDMAWIDDSTSAAESDDIECIPSDTTSTTVIFVDTTGIFKRRVQWCLCSTAPGPDIQLLQMRFFPASLINPKTAFSFNVLEQFRIEAMESKTSALSFYSKLCQVTNNCFPHTIPVG